MKKLKLSCILILSLIFLSSCITYTVKDGLNNIETIRTENPKETRLKQIEINKAAEEAEKERIEAEKKAAAQKKYDEEQSLKQNLEAVNIALEKQAALNPYPQDLTKLQTPHIYRPVNSKEVLDSKFTVINTLLLPLGEEPLTSENITLIAQNIKTIPLQFIFVTGSVENQVAFTKLLNKDAVTLDGGTIIFTPEVKEANSKNLVFTLNNEKEISLSVIDATATGYKETLALIDTEYGEEEKQDSKSFDLGLLTKLSKDSFETNKNLIDSSLEGLTDTAIFAISQSEPVTADWSIFTPYSYRTDFEWPVGAYILEKGYRDTFDETRYSVEESAGITQEVGNYIKERLDFLYSKGLMEVTSTTLAVSGLTDTATPTFAVLASYIMP